MKHNAYAPLLCILSVFAGPTLGCGGCDEEPIAQVAGEAAALAAMEQVTDRAALIAAEAEAAKYHVAQTAGLVAEPVSYTHLRAHET